MLDKIKWILKQLVPCRYISKYKQIEQNREVSYLSVFNMWFGVVFNHRKFRIYFEVDDYKKDSNVN